ncbi:hypothetical protein RO3G_06316 [Lichtheimia corymbifera JMRC:FSU:9682]|uniref:Transmembrane protein 198 n=1 Tax=Lichtheimia corymbifera JMRC:FSU:9682 TaxID=1263082 RepID=A0A068SCN2_9FUNG|nr:hypothetical protein RO3G_06316 [Lichtheimia corymbifera JMRC:FSU:9682]
MKRALYTLTWLIACLAANALPLVARDPLDGENTIELPISGHTISVHGVVLSIILFISGLYLCFLGGVHQKFTMFIVGFYVGANVAYIILSNAKPDYGSNTETILLVVSVVVGLLAGALLSCCFFLAVYLLGALLGYLAALWFLSWSDNGVIQSNWGRAILIVCCVVVGVVLMAFLERPMIVIATAFIGSFLIFFGIDLYVQTGFTTAVASFLHARNVDTLIQSSSGVRGMLGGTLALTVVSALLQWLHIRRRQQPVMVWSQQYPMRSGYGWRRV